MKNEMFLEFDAISDNESFARVSVAAFVSALNPTLEEISDIKTAVSEAVTNAIIHGYMNTSSYEKGKKREVENNHQKVQIFCTITDEVLEIKVKDEGRGIENIEQAMQPLFTTKPELERSGMGFAFMEAFMDDLQVQSKPGEGTIITMKKKIGIGPWIQCEE